MKQIKLFLLFTSVFIVSIEQNYAQENVSNKKSKNLASSKKPTICNLKKSPTELFSVQEHLMPHGLNGISEEQIKQHWELYKGYVAQSNQLHAEIQKHIKAGTTDSPACADRRRRYGFEFNGMVLHEYYFGNMKGKSEPLRQGEFLNAIIKQYGSFGKWKEDFINTGKMRGIGWAIMVYDPANGLLTNIFVADHEIGNIAGFCPILVMDVWEHAYMVDHKATQRPDYITEFMKNIYWEILEDRYLNAKKSKRH